MWSHNLHKISPPSSKNMIHSMEGKFYVGLWKYIKFPLPNYGREILCGVFGSA